MVQHSGVDPFFGWGGGGGAKLEKWPKKKMPRFARKVPVSNFSRVAHHKNENCVCFVVFLC